MMVELPITVAVLLSLMIFKYDVLPQIYAAILWSWSNRNTNALAFEENATFLHADGCKQIPLQLKDLNLNSNANQHENTFYLQLSKFMVIQDTDARN